MCSLYSIPYALTYSSRLGNKRTISQLRNEIVSLIVITEKLSKQNKQKWGGGVSLNFPLGEKVERVKWHFLFRLFSFFARFHSNRFQKFDRTFFFPPIFWRFSFNTENWTGPLLSWLSFTLFCGFDAHYSNENCRRSEKKAKNQFKVFPIEFREKSPRIGKL